MSKIQELGPQDASEMSVLYGRCFPDTWETSFFDDKLKSSCVAYGVFQDKHLRGFIFAQVIQGEAEILTFCVEEGCRRQGLGEALLKYLIQQSKIQTCFLEVNSNNPSAIRLYERLSFKNVGRRAAYYTSGAENAQDAIIYRYSKKVD